MVSVKKQGPYEVFSRGVEEPWVIWLDDRPYRQVWTWSEVERILHGDEPAPLPRATAKPAKSKLKSKSSRA